MCNVLVEHPTNNYILDSVAFKRWVMNANERYVPYKPWVLVNNMILKENGKLSTNTDWKIYVLDKKLSWEADRDVDVPGEILLLGSWEDPHDSYTEDKQFRLMEHHFKSCAALISKQFLPLAYYKQRIKLVQIILYGTKETHI